MLAGGPGLRASLTQEVQAGSRLCNKSHVSVFVYTSESQDLSGNEQHWCGLMIHRVIQLLTSAILNRFSDANCIACW